MQDIVGASLSKCLHLPTHLEEYRVSILTGLLSIHMPWSLLQWLDIKSQLGTVYKGRYIGQTGLSA